LYAANGWWDAVMDVAFSGGAGTGLWTYEWNGTEAQIFREELAAEGGVYLHPAYDRWLCLQGNGYGHAVTVEQCNGQAFQRWDYFWDYATQNYYIQDTFAGHPYCMNVEGGIATRARIIQWECVDTPNNHWSIFSPP
jgi:hypothetical protein